MKNSSKKKVLVAPVNWGIGHATRCIPVIQKLLSLDYEVVIASDGLSLELLRNEFPMLKWIELPSYNIRYSKRKYWFKFKLISQLFKIGRAVSEEYRLTKKLVESQKFSGIISDGRLGVRSKIVPSVYITHQLKLFTGSTSFFSTALHQFYIKKFDQCWVPDISNRTSCLSGKMGHLSNKKNRFSIKYIGILSRMKKEKLPVSIALLAILSGPEPQRTMLEEKLIKELSKTQERTVIVQGLIGGEQIRKKTGNIELINFMLSGELQDAINQSEIIISRSGYSSVMDFSKMGKKVFFIPTPGQYEQQYLARRLKYYGKAPFVQQEHFVIDDLQKTIVYNGLSVPEENIDWKNLFKIFD